MVREKGMKEDGARFCSLRSWGGGGFGGGGVVGFADVTHLNMQREGGGEKEKRGSAFSHPRSTRKNRVLTRHLQMLSA